MHYKWITLLKVVYKGDECAKYIFKDAVSSVLSMADQACDKSVTGVQPIQTQRMRVLRVVHSFCDMADQRSEISEFSLLTFLLQSISAINLDNGFQSTFVKENKVDLPAALSLLEAVTSILAQSDHDVIAACYYRSHNDQVVENGSKVPGFDIDIPEEKRLEAKDLHPLRIVVTSNPVFEDIPPDLNVNKKHKLTLLPEGISYWDNVQNYEWHCALKYVYFHYNPFLFDNVIKEIPLSTCAATLSAYLNQYNLADTRTQAHYFHKFTCFLLSTRWKKMHQWITSWQAIGFLYALTSITTDNLTLLINFPLSMAWVTDHCTK